MTSTEKIPGHNSRSRVIDACVVLFCVAGAAFTLNLFRLDLFQSIASINNKPVGTVSVKYNNVQRRFSDRVLWSRLTIESPVYIGDLIRVAEYSAATLYVNSDVIDLDENTLIRIRASEDGDGRVIIDLGSGSLSITAAAENAGDTNKSGAAVKGVALNIRGSLVEPQAGSTLSASAGDNGIAVHVNYGELRIKIKNGLSRLFTRGGILTLDADGVEQPSPAAVVTLPRPKARFVKSSAGQALNIPFAWNTVNIDPEQPLRLEISADRKFKNVRQTIEGVGSANAALDAGTWYWRLLYQNKVLGSGVLTAVDSDVVALVSPINESLFRYRENPPSVRFEWRPVENASGYILEAGFTPDFVNPVITRQTAVSSFVGRSMQAGTWYWRVKPVFSSLFEGTADFSQPSSFSVEKSASIDSRETRLDALVSLILPAPKPEVKQETASKPEASSARQAALPSGLLPEARNLMPESGKRIKFQELRATRRIDFSWARVAGANAYIFTLYQQDGGARKQIIQTKPLQKTEWTLDNLALIDRGNFVWQVEAVSMNQSGGFDRRGKIKENTFVIDIPLPGKPEIKDIEVVNER